MFKPGKITLGVAPTKRSFLSMEAAFEQKRQFMKAIRGILSDKVKIVDVDDLIENGILWDRKDLEPVIDKFRRSKIDALFIPHCDFGTEEVVGKLASAFKLPTLLWGPRDEYPNTARQRGRDTQCGIFASSKVLQRYGVAFSYIINSRTDSPEFINGFEKFLRVSSVIKTFRNLRIAQISTRPKPFMSVICNEGELLSRFGIETVPLSVNDLVTRTLDLVKTCPPALQESIEDIQSRINCSQLSSESLRKAAALKAILVDMIDENGCTAAAPECWSLFPKAMGIMPCFVISELMDMGYSVACETDINGAVTSAMLNAASMFDHPSFFADLTIRHPDNDNAELLWHCGPFPYGLKAEDSDACLNSGGAAEWQLRQGELTIARFDEINGRYSLFADHARTTTGPSTTGTYVWAETGNWKRWEEKFIFGPYIHHVAGTYGKYREILKESVKYINGLDWDPLEIGFESL